MPSMMLNPELSLDVLVLAALGLAVVAVAGIKLAAFLRDFNRIACVLRPIPLAPGYHWLLGHVIPMLTCVKDNKGPWDIMEEWLNTSGPIVRFRILNTQGVLVKDPQALKRIFQTRFKVYEKDLGLSYAPFLPILGTGLVTADGDLWQKQRTLIGPALRLEILDVVIDIAQRATDRLTAKLQAFKGSGKAVDLEEEFRLLKLQVGGGRAGAWAGNTPSACAGATAPACTGATAPACMGATAPACMVHPKPSSVIVHLLFINVSSSSSKGVQE